MHNFNNFNAQKLRKSAASCISLLRFRFRCNIVTKCQADYYVDQNSFLWPVYIELLLEVMHTDEFSCHKKRTILQYFLSRRKFWKIAWPKNVTEPEEFQQCYTYDIRHWQYDLVKRNLCCQILGVLPLWWTVLTHFVKSKDYLIIGVQLCFSLLNIQNKQKPGLLFFTLLFILQECIALWWY